MATGGPKGDPPPGKLVNKINQARLRYEKLKSFEERGIKLTEEERKELKRLEENLAEWEKSAVRWRIL